jgi:hypothetical protein
LATGGRPGTSIACQTADPIFLFSTMLEVETNN